METKQELKDEALRDYIDTYEKLMNPARKLYNKRIKDIDEKV